MSYYFRMVQLCSSILFCIVLFLYSAPLLAQEQNADAEKSQKFGTVYGIHTGPLLPNQIQGMTEIMPLWGIHYGSPLRKGILELGIANARSKGVEYYNGSASIRGDYNIEDLYALVYAGVDTHYYATEGSTFKMYFGAHVGGGFAVHLGDIVWFRTDMKFNVNPGTALYIGFGLELRMPDGEAGGDQGN